VYCKKIDSIQTKLTEEIHFEVCHSGNLLPIVACSAAAVDDRDVRIQKCCVRIIPRILTTDLRWILIVFTYLEMGMNAHCKQAIYLLILHVM